MRMRGSLDDCILSNSFHRPHQSGQLWSLLFSAPASPISLGKLLQYLRDFCKTRLCKSWLLRSHNCKVLTIHGNKNAFVWPLTNIQNPCDKTFLNLDFHNNDKKKCKMAAWVNAKDEISRRRPLPPRYVLSCQVIMQGGGFLWRGPTNHFRSITCLQQISWLPSISDKIFFFSKYNHQ